MSLSKDSALLDPKSWATIPTQTLIEQRQSNEKLPGRGAVRHAGLGIGPADAYVYLKARFGSPNGILTMLRTPSSDNLFHWHYTLSAAASRLEVFGVASRLEMHVTTTEPFDDADWPRIANAIKGDMKRVGPAMSEVRRGLEPWRLFVNPYRRASRIVDAAAKRLEELRPTLQSFAEPAAPTVPAENLAAEMRALFERQAEAASLGTTLRMLCPVVGEAFLNSLIFLLAKPDLRKDKRVYEAAIRAEIDVRIKSLPVTCDGFRRAPADTDARMKAFLSLMNHRNFILHGNVDPLQLDAGEVFFDDKHIALFPTEQSFFERSYALQLAHIAPEVALRDHSTVTSFVPCVLECIEPALVPEIEAFLGDSMPGIRVDTGRPGILFSDLVLDMWFG